MPEAAPAGTGHDAAARAVAAPGAAFVPASGTGRLSSNPMGLLEEAREGTLYCAEIGQYSKGEQKGLAFLLPKLEKYETALVCTSSEPLGNLAAEGRFDAALLSQLAAGAVMLPPLRNRRDDIPPLIERSQDVFRRDLPRLLREHPRQWVAYHGDERVAVGPSKRQLYQKCLRRGLRVGEFVVRSIEPEVPREVEHFNDV